MEVLLCLLCLVCAIVAIVFIFISGININITVNHDVPEIKSDKPLQDIYDKNGDLKDDIRIDENERTDIDELLQELNKFMNDEE